MLLFLLSTFSFGSIHAMIKYLHSTRFTYEKRLVHYTPPPKEITFPLTYPPPLPPKTSISAVSNTPLSQIRIFSGEERTADPQKGDSRFSARFWDQRGLVLITVVVNKDAFVMFFRSLHKVVRDKVGCEREQ